MNPKAMDPFGMALLAYFEGDRTAELIIHRDDGQKTPLPVGFFFRNPPEFTPLENAALDRCTGRILDVGAGSGLHSLVLQGEDLSVTAIDISPHAVNVMKQRGLKDVHCADIFEFQGGPFDTLLLIGHGIGMVETIAGLDRFLAHARGLLSENGQVLLDSLDVRITDDPSNLAYHQANRQAGRYIGETRLRFEFRGEEGPTCGWLHVDAETLIEHAGSPGWRCEVIHREAGGDHLTRLIKQEAA
jgi:SAM-dependent methyltransferase